MTIKIKKLTDKARLPVFATEGSAGSDLYACTDEPVHLSGGQRTLVSAGFAIEIPQGYAGFVFPRSSVASKYGISLSNCVGVIDSDYRGEVKIAVINHSAEEFVIEDGDRIAQLIIMPYARTEYIQADELEDTKRGGGGFGSTGK